MCIEEWAVNIHERLVAAWSKVKGCLRGAEVTDGTGVRIAAKAFMSGRHLRGLRETQSTAPICF